MITLHFPCVSSTFYGSPLEKKYKTIYSLYSLYNFRGDKWFNRFVFFFFFFFFFFNYYFRLDLSSVLNGQTFLLEFSPFQTAIGEQENMQDISTLSPLHKMVERFPGNNNNNNNNRECRS